jgi:hypothetical protein
VAGRYRLAFAARVSGHTTDRHVDAEAGRRSLFFRLATPEAVLAVFPRPSLALDERRARLTHVSGLSFACGPGLGPFAGRREEQPRLTAARGLFGPLQWTGENEVRDRLRCHVVPLSRGIGLFDCEKPSGD